MRALLVNPWIYDFAAYDLWSKPLGLLHLAAFLENNGWTIDLIDCLDRSNPDLHNNIPKKYLASSIYGDGEYFSEPIEKPFVLENISRKYKRYGLPIGIFKMKLDRLPAPDIILVTSGMTYWYPSYIDAIKLLKDAFPSTRIILGGIYATLCHYHAVTHSGADAVFKGNDISAIKNLISGLTGFRFSYSEPEYFDRIIPAYHLYKNIRYVTLRTSTGCPNKCTYCGWYLLGDKLKQQDPAFVIDEIALFYEKYGIRDFAFYDEALLFNPERHIIKILKGLIKLRILAHFHTPNGLHNKLVTSEIACLFKEAGFVNPRLALETSSIKRQLSTGNKTTNSDFLSALSSLSYAGYKPNNIGVYLLIGLPGQSTDEIKESIRFASSQGVRVHLEEYSPIPNTPDYKSSGLPEDADPLLHNNSVFPLYAPERHHIFQEIKDYARSLNNSNKEVSYN